MRSTDDAHPAAPPRAATIPPRATSRAGEGRIVTARVDGASTVVTSFATSPMKLLVPRPRAACAWAFVGTFGGGLLAGDRIDLRADVGAGSSLLLGTQASTKIYRSPLGVPATQSLRATVAPGAALLVLPDPVTCFAQASYEQRQRFDVAEGGTLVLLDWLTSGRRARGERWTFSRYLSRNDIVLAGRPVLGDALLLDGEFEPIDAPHRMGRFHCYATLALMGPRAVDGARRILAELSAMPVRRGAPLLTAASLVADGAIVRVLGDSSEAVGAFLRERLAFAWEIAGQDPWSRKM